MFHQRYAISKLTEEIKIMEKTRETRMAGRRRRCSFKGTKGSLTGEDTVTTRGRNGALGISLPLTDHKILNK